MHFIVDPTPSPSDESALPGRSGQSHPAASHVMIAIGTLVIITATIVSLAACYYQWRKRSKIIANGINDCLIRKLFLCCSRVSSFLSGSSGSSIVKPDTPQLLPSQSFHTCAIDSNTATSRKTYVGEGTTRVDDMADSWKTLADQDGLVCVSTTARKIGDVLSEDIRSNHVNGEPDDVAGNKITVQSMECRVTGEFSGLSPGFSNGTRRIRRSSSFMEGGTDDYDNNDYGKSVWSEDSGHRTMSTSPELHTPSSSAFSDSPGRKEGQVVEDVNRSYDFSLRLVGASNRPGSFLGIPAWRPSVIRFSPPVNIRTYPVNRARTLPARAVRYRPPTPPPWSLNPHHFLHGGADMGRLDTSVSIAENTLDITQCTEDVNVSHSPKQRPANDKLVDTIKYGGVIAIQAHQPVHQAEKSVHTGESDGAVTGGTEGSVSRRVFANGGQGSSCDDQNLSAADVSIVSTPDLRKVAAPDSFECETECIDAATNIMAAILCALRDNTVEPLPIFEYSDDDESNDNIKVDSSCVSSLLSSYSSEETSGHTAGKRSSVSVSITSIRHSNDDVVISPDMPVRVVPFARIHRRTGAVFIKVKYTKGRYDIDNEISFEDASLMLTDNRGSSTPMNTKWAPVDGMMIVKVFVPETDDIWKVRVPEDITLPRFSSRVLSKLGFHVAFSGSCFDGPEYYFRNDETFRYWIDKRIRNGRNLPIVSHVIDPPSSPRCSVDAPPASTTASTTDLQPPKDLSCRRHHDTLIRHISGMGDIFPCRRP